MQTYTCISKAMAWVFFMTLPASVLFPVLCFGRGEEVTSFINRYKQYEVSTGYYETYEMRPRHESPLVSRFRGRDRDPFGYTSTSASVRNRHLLSDSHRGIKFYDNSRCEMCHANETRDIHTVRANLTCRQCHGAEPIASIDHYYSPLNPIRRHAYVCSKCHEGASASFASYVIHEPAAGSADSKTQFPALFYAYWFMLILLAGTLAFFIPHSIMMGVRELFGKSKDR